MKNSEKAVDQLLNLYRHRKALQVSLDLKYNKLIHEVGEQSLSSLKIEIASNTFSQSEDAAIWNVIQPLFNECECSYMCGYKRRPEELFEFNKATNGIRYARCSFPV
ncbi:WD repeat-containing protein 19 [Tritrichomonas musculus]|uniref:WD repeat-containing protein 19 n=1 Tax=Tritrichomonas musculus TaxID=1915356 RepID=A0ABR2K3D3_9EUKA